MSYFDDYVADGLCCQVCGAYIDGEEPGFPRTCEDCLQFEEQEIKKQQLIKKGKKILEEVEQKLQANNISYVLKNSSTGHFHTRTKYDNQLIEYYAFTGKISIIGQIQKPRGIKALLEILLRKPKNKKINKGGTNENTSK